MFFPYSTDTQREWEYRQELPVVVYALLIACIGIHVAVVAELDPPARNDLMYRFGVVKYDLRWYTFLTCTFLHAGWGHLIGNMYFLWLYGRDLERLLGSWRFAAGRFRPSLSGFRRWGRPVRFQRCWAPFLYCFRRRSCAAWCFSSCVRSSLRFRRALYLDSGLWGNCTRVWSRDWERPTLHSGALN